MNSPDAERGGAVTGDPIYLAMRDQRDKAKRRAEVLMRERDEARRERDDVSRGGAVTTQYERSLKSQVEQAEARVRELEAALRPFAEAHRQNESGAYKEPAVAVTIADSRDPWEVAASLLTPSDGEGE